jgi:hypothetical protein
MKRGKPIFLSLLILFVWATLTLTAPLARAQDAQPNQDNSTYTSDVRVARLSFALGDVQYQRPNEDRQPAPANLPIEEGFRLVTANGRAEVQLDSGVAVRLAENSELEFSKLAFDHSGRVTALTLIQGSIEVTADTIHDESFFVDAPGMRVTVLHSARFRMDTTQGDGWASVMKGDVQVAANSGETRLSAGHTMHIIGANPDQASIELNAPLDDFDRWASGRDLTIEQGYSQALAYVEPYDPDYADYSYGISDLSSYGYWSYLTGLGYCWQPYGVAVGWVPFYYGSWLYERHHHWTWVSNEPWGWLPYHTGHWINAGGRGWMWQPGTTRTWNPAPVNWLRVGNQIAWAPAGSVKANGALPETGVVTGELNPRGNVIKGGGRFPVTAESFARPALAPNAPVNAPHSEAVAPANGTIAYDPAARTYLNSHPARESGSAQSQPAVNSTPALGASFARTPVNPPQSSNQVRPAYVPAQVHPQPTAPAPRYTPPPQQHFSAPAPSAQHFSPPPSPPPASHASAPPASHSEGGSSSGHH